jgi:hypothetical protein
MSLQKTTILLSLTFASIFVTQAQKKRSITELSQEEIQKLRDRRSIQFEAVGYTRKKPELGITVMRDTTHQKAFDVFKNTLSKKLTEKGIPHKFFIEIIDDKKGAAFAYFIKGRQHGVFNFDEFVALLPEAVRDFRKAFPKTESKIQP